MNTLVQRKYDHYADLDQLSLKETYQNAINTFHQKIYSIGGSSESFNLPINLTPSLLSKNQFTNYKNCCDKFNTIIEKLGDYLVEQNADLLAFFNIHAHYFPYMRSKRYLNNLYCRYDFFIDHSGQLKFCETNTHGGGGFYILSMLSQLVYKYMHLATIASPQPYHNEHYFSQGIIRLEQQSAITPQGIAILYDDKSPLFTRPSLQYFELLALAKQLSANGRPVFLADVKNLMLNTEGTLCYQDHPISTTFNRIRVVGSDMYCNEIYKPYLQSVKNATVLPINSIAGLTVLQDKSLFELLTSQKYHHLFTSDEIYFLDAHIPKTKRLTSSKSEMEKFIRNKNQFVIKPSNLARGQGVKIGECLAQSEGNELFTQFADKDFIVQEKVNSPSASIIQLTADGASETQMQQVYSAFYLAGNYCGLMDRVSSESVTNVAGSAYARPIFVLNK